MSVAGNSEPRRVVDVTPVIVLGSARNGTTWLCNILSGHNAVMAAQHPAHWGFHESNVFKHFRYWGDLAPLDRRFRFLELYTVGDHFRLVNGDRAELEAQIESWTAGRPNGRSPDFYDAFFWSMDRFARGENKRYWLTKLDPLLYLYPRELDRFLRRLKERYGTIRYIAIHRDVAEVVRSYLNMEGRVAQRRTSRLRMPGFILFETARHVIHYRRIRSVAKNHGFPVISYQTLKDDTVQTIGDICRILGLSEQPGLEKLRYRANSSVAYRNTLRDIGPVSRWWIRLVLAPFLAVVWPATLLLLRGRERMRPAQAPVYFKLRKLERYPQQFRQELLHNDERALASLLFKQDDFIDDNKPR